MTPNQKGEIAELRVQLRAVEKGYVASRPSIPCRYDLIIDTGTELLRAQVKYVNSRCSHSKGSVTIGLRPGRERGKKRSSHLYTNDQIDLILVYVPAVDRVACLKPNDFAGHSTLTVRFERAKNQQEKGIRDLEELFW
jgi:hypothetical protein